MRKLMNILVFMATAMAIAACGNSASEELKDGKAVAVPEVNEVEVITHVQLDLCQLLVME